MTDRLQQALSLLGYSETGNGRDRHQLLDAIEKFAALQGDNELAKTALAEMDRIRNTNLNETRSQEQNHPTAEHPNSVEKAADGFKEIADAMRTIVSPYPAAAELAAIQLGYHDEAEIAGNTNEVTPYSFLSEVWNLLISRDRETKTAQGSVLARQHQTRSTALVS